MRWIGLFIGMAVSVALVAQEAPKKKRKPTAKEQSAKQVRGKPTPEQIRRFNELQKKNK